MFSKIEEQRIFLAVNRGVFICGNADENDHQVVHFSLIPLFR